MVFNTLSCNAIFYNSIHILVSFAKHKLVLNDKAHNNTKEEFDLYNAERQVQICETQSSHWDIR